MMVYNVGVVYVYGFGCLNIFLMFDGECLVVDNMCYV